MCGIEGILGIEGQMGYRDFVGHVDHTLCMRTVGYLVDTGGMWNMLSMLGIGSMWTIWVI